MRKKDAEIISCAKHTSKGWSSHGRLISCLWHPFEVYKLVNGSIYYYIVSLCFGRVFKVESALTDLFYLGLESIAECMLDVGVSLQDLKHVTCQ